MNERLTIIIRKQTALFAHLLLALPVTMAVAGLGIAPLLKLAFGGPPNPAYVLSISGLMFGTMFGTAWFTALRRQGTLVVEGDRIIASVLFRKRRVFDRARTEISLQPLKVVWGSGSGGGSQIGGIMLVFRDGTQELRLGFLDHKLGEALAQKIGTTDHQETQVRVRAQDFLRLAKHLDVEVPLPPDWRLPPKALV